jgi:hypothetical protein
MLDERDTGGYGGGRFPPNVCSLADLSGHVPMSARPQPLGRHGALTAPLSDF